MARQGGGAGLVSHQGLIWPCPDPRIPALCIGGRLGVGGGAGRVLAGQCFGSPTRPPARSDQYRTPDSLSPSVRKGTRSKLAESELMSTAGLATFGHEGVVVFYNPPREATISMHERLGRLFRTSFGSPEGLGHEVRSFLF